jgi:O-antigen ligase
VVLGGVILGFIHLVSNGRKNLAKKLLFFSLVFLFFFTIWTTILRQTEQGEYLTGKFENQMSGVLSKGIQNGDQTHRAELWETSMATIVNFPFLGLGPSTNRENPYLYKYVSGHSSWLDQPAEYGLIGFSTYILFFVLSVNRFWTACRKRNAKFYKENKYCFGALVSCFLFVVCGTYNPVVVVTETMSFFYFMTFCGEI